jgi:hypothetical protein
VRIDQWRRLIVLLAAIIGAAIGLIMLSWF